MSKTEDVELLAEYEAAEVELVELERQQLVSRTRMDAIHAHAVTLARMDAERSREAANRNRAIRDAYAAGETIAALSRATGLTRAMLYRILDEG